MTREEVLNTARQISSNNICLELPTSFGKTLDALTIVKERLSNKLVKNILIVIPKNVLKGEWEKEMIKWEMQDLIPCVSYSTYVSVPKQNFASFDAVIWDEVQHLTDRCMEALISQNIRSLNTINILLSATIKPSHKIKLHRLFYNLKTIKVSIKDAINEEVLPDPEILLIPLTLNKINVDQIYVKRKSAKKQVSCTYNNRWQYLKDKSARVNIWCTQDQYYGMLESDYTIATTRCREVWKRQLAIQRLKWLSEIKTPLIITLLKMLNNERTLTFCNSIEQCEQLGKYPIHSGSKALLDNLEKFNKGEIDHITSVRMLDEGMNAVNLRIGIYANINSSDIITKQRAGRILRHKKPIIIIPYYRNTREEEIVDNKIKLDFNPEKIHTINYLNEIKNYLK